MFNLSSALVIRPHAYSCIQAIWLTYLFVAAYFQTTSRSRVVHVHRSSKATMLHCGLSVLLVAPWHYFHIADALNIHPRSLALRPHRCHRSFDAFDAAPLFNRRLRICPRATKGVLLGVEEASTTHNDAAANMLNDFGWMNDASLFRLATSIGNNVEAAITDVLGLAERRYARALAS